MSSPDDQELLAPPLGVEERDRLADEGLISVSPEQWGCHVWRLVTRELVAEAMRRDKGLEQPGAADVEDDGTDESAADWMNAKRAAVRAAVRTVMGAFINDTCRLPAIGARTERIELQEGMGRVFFEDGTTISFSINDLRPKQSEPPCHLVMAAPESVDMVAAVRDGELLGAMDVNRRGARDVRFWGIKAGTPFELYVLHDVPMWDATVLADFGSRITRIRDGRRAWGLARRYAESHPFKRVR